MTHIKKNPVPDSRMSFGSGRRTGPVRRSQWSKEEDKILTTAVRKFNGRNWKQIAEHLPNRSSTQVLDPSLIKGHWTREEDEKIITLVKRYGAENWSQISSYLKGRIGKQCRERYLNHLDPTLKHGPWEEHEIRILMENQKKLGNKWSTIAKLLPGRTDNRCKNFYNSFMAKRRRLKVKHTRSISEGGMGSTPGGGFQQQNQMQPQSRGHQRSISQQQQVHIVGNQDVSRLLQQSFSEQKRLYDEFMAKNSIIERNQKLLYMKIQKMQYSQQVNPQELNKMMESYKKLVQFQQKQRDMFIQSMQMHRIDMQRQKNPTQRHVQIQQQRQTILPKINFNLELPKNPREIVQQNQIQQMQHKQRQNIYVNQNPFPEVQQHKARNYQFHEYQNVQIPHTNPFQSKILSFKTENVMDETNDDDQFGFNVGNSGFQPPQIVFHPPSPQKGMKHQNRRHQEFQKQQIPFQNFVKEEPIVDGLFDDFPVDDDYFGEPGNSFPEDPMFSGDDGFGVDLDDGLGEEFNIPDPFDDEIIPVKKEIPEAQVDIDPQESLGFDVDELLNIPDDDEEGEVSYDFLDIPDTERRRGPVMTRRNYQASNRRTQSFDSRILFSGY